MFVRSRSALAFALFLGLTACDSGGGRSSSTPTTPPPPPPPAPSIAGEWSGSEVVDTVRPDDLCVSAKYIEDRRARSVPVSATFSLNGTAITIVYHHTFGDYTATGTLDGHTFTATTTAADPAEHSMECRVPGTGRVRTRIASFAAQTIEGTANEGFTSITAHVWTRENTRSTDGKNTDPVATEATLTLTKP